MPALLISKGGRPVSATPSRTTSPAVGRRRPMMARDRKSTRLNSSHLVISYAVFCLKKKKDHRLDPTVADSRAVFTLTLLHLTTLGAFVCLKHRRQPTLPQLSLQPILIALRPPSQELRSSL